MNRQSEVALLRKQIIELGKHEAEFDAVTRRYVPKDGDVLVPMPIDPVLERLKKMTAEELLPFVTPGTGDRKRITQSLRKGHICTGDLEGLVYSVVGGNLLPDEVSARAASLAEWAAKNEAAVAAVRSQYQVILDKLAEVDQQIKEAQAKYESLTNLYEVRVSGTETRTQTRGVSGTIEVRALSVEEAIETAIETAIEKSDEVDWNEDGYYEDGDSEYEANDDVDESDVEVIEDNVGSVKAAGA